jgi:hypothetical protein
MTTETKIREAYGKAVAEDCCVCSYRNFKAGYMALLNELELVGENKVERLYRLPEGVTK